MPFDYTNSNLIASIKRRASMPTVQPLFLDSDFLALADEELATVIFPMIMEIKGEYFVTIDDQEMTTDLTYPIPSDAVGLKIKGVFWRDPTWPDNQPDNVVPWVDIMDITNQNAGIWNWLAYYIQDNSIKMLNTMPGNTLRIRYYKRASKLVPNDEGAQILDASSADIVVSNIPDTWEVGTELQLVQQNPPFETLTTALTITGITQPNILNLVEDDPDTPVFSESDLEGNWLSLVGESVIAQVTPEAQIVLAQAVAVKCLEALADPNLATAQGKFEQIKQNFIKTMMPRADGQAKKIINRGGPLIWNKLGYWGWGWR